MKIKLAEVKPLKVGELLTGNADDNPELSLCEKESVETGQAVCLKCKRGFKKKRKDQKYCNKKCRSAFVQQSFRIRHGLIEKPYCGRGKNQEGSKNHQFKNGWSTYRKKALKTYEDICSKCSSDKFLVVHHIDHDRSNSDLRNLTILCKKCHQDHHCKRDRSGKYKTQRDSPSP